MLFRLDPLSDSGVSIFDDSKSSIIAVNGGNPLTSTDDLPEGSTNLYSQWQQDTVSSRQYISPKTEGDVLYIGDRDAASALESSFPEATAMLPGTGTGGTNYFINPGYGENFISFGGLFAAGRARGTHASPTDVQDGDWLGGFTAVAYLNGGWVDGSTFALPGMYMSQLDHSGSDFGTRLYLGSALFEGLTVDMPITGTPQTTVYINRPNADVDFQVNWDGGTSIFSEGSTGNIGIGTASPSARLHINGTANDQQLIVRGHSTQTANLQEWQTSAGTAVASIDKDGNFVANVPAAISAGFKWSAVSSTQWLARINSNDGNALAFDAQNSALNNILRLQKTGEVGINASSVSGNTLFVQNAAGSANSKVTSAIAAITSQTGDLQQWQNSSGTALARVRSDGTIDANGGGSSGVALGVQPSGANVYGILAIAQASPTKPVAEFRGGANSSNDPTVLIKAGSSQTANLQEWQNSSGTVLSAVDASGNIGIGISAPSNGLHIRKTSSGSDVAATIQNNSNTAGSQAVLWLRNGGTSGGNALVRFTDGTGNWAMGALVSNDNFAINNSTALANSGSNIFEIATGAPARSLYVNSSGYLEIGSSDTNLYRSAANTLKTDDKLVVSDKFNQISAANNAFGSATGLTGVQLSVLTTSASRVGLTIQGYTSQTANLQDWQDSSANILASLTADGKLTFGTTGDTNLYRSTADILKTDDSLVVGTDLEIDGALDHDGTTAGLYGVTPVTRATTGIAEATFTENAGGTAVNVDSTFGGYTLQQVVQALQDIGILT